jgi:hypothetical protein
VTFVWSSFAIAVRFGTQYNGASVDRWHLGSHARKLGLLLFTRAAANGTVIVPLGPAVR